LWQILRQGGIKGRLFQALNFMYNSVKSCIRCHAGISDYIDSNTGLKQGCLASPILFSFYINELVTIFEQHNVRGIQLHPDIMQISLLMFADDLALISDTIVGLQNQLNILSNFCNDYKLKVNEDKTKVVVFKNGGALSRFEHWTYQNTYLQAVNCFTYVGLCFTKQLSYNSMVHDLCVKGKRVLISLLKSTYHLGPVSKHVFFKIFDTKICTQLCYGSEIWGLSQYDELERCHYYACKRFMCTKQNACNYFVLGECQRYPMYITTYKRCIKYWLKILNMSDTRYVKKCYNMMLMDDANGRLNWVSKVRNCLCQHGFGYVWQNQYVQSESSFLRQFVKRMMDMFVQNWHASINSNAKLESYCMYKNVFTYEPYLDVLNIRKFRSVYVNFRTSCHNLEIERGRYSNTPREERLCKLCASNVIEDEYHFLLCCEFYDDLRNLYVPNKFHVNTSRNKFHILMSSRSMDHIKGVATFLFHAFNKRSVFLMENGL